MFSVAFEVLSARTPHPAEPARAKHDGEGSSQFSDMVDEPSTNCGPKGNPVNPPGLVSGKTDVKVAARTSASVSKQEDAAAALLDSGDGQASSQAATDDLLEPTLPNDQPGAADPDAKAQPGKQATIDPVVVVVDPIANSCASAATEGPADTLEAEFLATSEDVKAAPSSAGHENSKVSKRAAPHDEKSTKAAVSVDTGDQAGAQIAMSGTSQPAVATAVVPVATVTPDASEDTTEDAIAVITTSASSTVLAEKIGGRLSEKPGSGPSAKTQTLDTATIVADAEAGQSDAEADQLLSPELPPNIAAAAHIASWRAHDAHAALATADPSADAKSNSAPATPEGLAAPESEASGLQPQVAATPSVARAPRAGDIESQKPVPSRQDVLSVDVFVAAKSSATPSSTDGTATLNGLPIAPAVQIQDAGPAATAAQSAPAALVPVAGIAVEIATKALAGKNRFEIRLDPPELGRIHVRLDLDHSGEISSHLVVDRSETLDLLRRDAPSLERALQDAGLKTTNNGLQFSLRDHGFGRHEQPAAFHATARVVVPDDNVAPEVTLVGYRPLARLRSGLDIRI